ncbi:ABC transporter permease [Martelella sp. HB161492]|uniref:ABC transporter permease n=1 Tax=Martelella sp. HB161492 TaxID=2720726 RepID=UPI001591C97F|nr:ABC transporter permease [Martelella sp. HB161492]
MQPTDNLPKRSTGEVILSGLRLLVVPLVAVLISMVIGGIIVLFLGENPFEVYAMIFEGSVVGLPNFLVTLQFMTPLLFTGLAIGFSFRSGLVNIGAEGQLIVGALFAGIAGYAFDMPAYIHLPVCIIAAIIGGMLWGLLPALLRVYFNVNELVVCLMMNPIALLLTGWIAARVLKAPGPTNKLPDIMPSAELANFSIYSQFNVGFVIAIALCLVFRYIYTRTKPGFEFKMIGMNPRFAHYGGIRVRRQALTVFLVSSGIAGLGGAEQVLGQYRAFYENFSPGYGFDGIAVAMLANNNPIGIIFAAFLFGALNSGGVVLQMMTGLSKHLVQVLQFIIVLILAANFTWPQIGHWLTRNKATKTADRQSSAEE